MNSQKNKPLVSVLICSYNAAKFIQSTILSVLNQSYPNLELLILDNASTDDRVAIVKQLTQRDKRVKVITSDKNLGPYKGLNFLLEKAKGSYIAINDHDDIWHPDKLAVQVDFLEKNLQYVGCGTAIVNWYEKYEAYQYRTQSGKSVTAWHTSLIFRNRRFRYDAHIKVGTDFYFMKHILCKGGETLFNFGEPYVLRRIFSENLSGKWMKKVSIGELLTLDIGLIDKLSLINRYFIPEEVVNWVIVTCFARNIPKKYEGYTKTLFSILSSPRS